IYWCSLVVVFVGYVCFGFFFQAEDGIRDGHVTGVQTCAFDLRLDLPRDRFRLQKQAKVIAAARFRISARHVETAERMDADQRARSEERRVGKECRSGRSADV